MGYRVLIQRMCSQKHYFVHGETFLLIGINGAESENLLCVIEVCCCSYGACSEKYRMPLQAILFEME